MRMEKNVVTRLQILRRAIIRTRLRRCAHSRRRLGDRRNIIFLLLLVRVLVAARLPTTDAAAALRLRLRSRRVHVSRRLEQCDGGRPGDRREDLAAAQLARRQVAEGDRVTEVASVR
jgi:hypothetical protein